MRISADTYLPFPPSLVYATFRDRLVEVVAMMPNIERFKLVSRQQDDDRVSLICEWQGSGEIPAIARMVLSETMLLWTEFTTWDQSTLTTEWRIQTHAFPEAVICSGINRFLVDNGGTRIENRGELTIDPLHLKGIPSIFTGMVARTVEDLLGKRIGPNLLRMAEGVQRYLEQHPQG
ncbi:hypothetical protein DO97_17010 [Neosynechococcus sphagnicola sy1]|uniref:Cyclase n=1 Tax=Neosynechococcus sphagnicola sy1 TaxID=1497020 RepID=A0A098THR5_9CYAN|nr:hypothetical protein [Neosynechococcus sphagnicola]KGF71634.1 hypothetical protein DO97_17010 [Neosynechococcus sphagnicola sy1]